MELTYEMLGIRPLLIEKLNIDPISRSRSFIRIATALMRAGYAPATRRTEVITPSWLQPEAKGKRGRPDSLIIKAEVGRQQGIKCGCILPTYSNLDFQRALVTVRDEVRLALFSS